ncbi:MAG TPA: MFS transporter [Dehalococcoidia bacterium]|nr:MFS transporter [Dehalococcoidia bacterium]
MVQTHDTTQTVPGIAGYLGRLSAVWRQGDFRWYWLASSIQGLGQSTQFMVIGWLVLEITGSSAQLGLVISLYGVPNVSFLLVAGVVADRFDRRHIMMLTQLVVGGIITALAVLTITAQVSTWHIYVAAVLMGVFQSLSMPARMTIIGDLVDQPSVLNAVAMQNMAVHAGRMIGPPVAGVIIEVWSVGVSLAFIAGCYVLSVLLVGKIGPISRSVAPAAQSVFRNFADGVVYIKNNPTVLTVIVITCAFGGFGMSHMQVVPAMAKDVLGIGAGEIGLLFLGSAIGSLAGSMILPAIPRAYVYRALLLSLLIFTVFLTLFAWSDWFWVTFVFFSLVGVVGVGMVWPLATTMVQIETTAEVRGRVMGMLQFTPGFHFLGAFPLALAAGQFGWEVAITGAVGLSLATTVWFAFVRRGAPKMGRQEAAAA